MEKPTYSEEFQEQALCKLYHRNGHTMKAIADELNVPPRKLRSWLESARAKKMTTSLSRPSVSNDNPYSESAFNTLKYRPEYSVNPFNNLQDARAWVEHLVHWYNQEHRHSAIEFVTPAQRHAGLDKALLAQSNTLYEKARAANPTRWAAQIRQWPYVKEVHLNP